jgi:hypothetical protein
VRLEHAGVNIWRGGSAMSVWGNVGLKEGLWLVGLGGGEGERGTAGGLGRPGTQG